MRDHRLFREVSAKLIMFKDEGTRNKLYNREATIENAVQNLGILPNSKPYELLIECLNHIEKVAKEITYRTRSILTHPYLVHTEVHRWCGHTRDSELLMEFPKREFNKTFYNIYLENRKIWEEMCLSKPQDEKLLETSANLPPSALCQEIKKNGSLNLDFFPKANLINHMKKLSFTFNEEDFILFCANYKKDQELSITHQTNESLIAPNVQALSNDNPNIKNAISNEQFESTDSANQVLM